MGEICRSFAAVVACLLVSSLARGAWGAEPPTAGFPTEPAATTPAVAPKDAAAPAPSASVAEPPPPVVYAAAPAPTALPPANVGTPPSPEPAATPPRDLTLSLSPLHLLMPVLELQAELRVGRYVGFTAFGGVGRVTVEVPDSRDPRETDDEALTLYEAGAILSFYPLEPFRSLMLGAELGWVQLSSDDIGDESIRGFATGLSVGPLLGYKHVSAAGFTVVVQGGVARIAIHAEASDEVDTEQDDDEQWVPILNLNLGWSF